MSSILDDNERMNHGLSRRRFLSVGILTLASGMAPHLCLAAVKMSSFPKRTLSFYNTHTGESLDATYWADGKYLAPALSDINRILRDHRSGDIKPINTRLLDLLYAMKVKLRPRHAFHIVSGYRSPGTNALLRAKNGGVAKNSYHMKGKAIDIRVPGCPLPEMNRTAKGLRAGGVGYYPRSDFIHVDVGPVRSW
ncbi:MAG: DUF882 domain-containing protein [Desulfatiglandales bacterium]